MQLIIRNNKKVTPRVPSVTFLFNNDILGDDAHLDDEDEEEVVVADLGDRDMDNHSNNHRTNMGCTT